MIGAPGSLACSARLAALLLLGVCALGCRGKPKPAPVAAAVSAAPKLPVDHLNSDELGPGKTEVFGFPVPVGMEVESRLPDRVYLRGRVSPEGLANYVRQQVSVSHVEIGAARTVFPQARIKAGPRDRVYNLEVLPDHDGTRLVILDVTPPPPPPPGMTDEERWRAAGIGPDGRPLDLKKLE